MWFNAPMKISEIQNAGAFDGVQLAECDLTPFDACGFVLSERKKDSKVTSLRYQRVFFFFFFFWVFHFVN